MGRRTVQTGIQEKMGEYKGMLMAHDMDPEAGTVGNKSQATDETPI
jgi:hypothetical protein